MEAVNRATDFCSSVQACLHVYAIVFCSEMCPEILFLDSINTCFNKVKKTLKLLWQMFMLQPYLITHGYQTF